jgi:hypothetical protein
VVRRETETNPTWCGVVPLSNPCCPMRVLAEAALGPAAITVSVPGLRSFTPLIPQVGSPSEAAMVTAVVGPLADLTVGLPLSPLPPPAGPRDPAVPHAPKRNVPLNAAETRVCFVKGGWGQARAVQSAVHFSAWPPCGTTPSIRLSQCAVGHPKCAAILPARNPR